MVQRSSNFLRNRKDTLTLSFLADFFLSDDFALKQILGTTRLPFFNASRHASACGYRPLDCIHAARGCQKKLNAKDLQMHSDGDWAEDDTIVSRTVGWGSCL